MELLGRRFGNGMGSRMCLFNQFSKQQSSLMFKLFIKCDGADQNTSSLAGFSDKLDFLDGDQKPLARGSKEGAKGQQTKKGY